MHPLSDFESISESLSARRAAHFAPIVLEVYSNLSAANGELDDDVRGVLGRTLRFEGFARRRFKSSSLISAHTDSDGRLRVEVTENGRCVSMKRTGPAQPLARNARVTRTRST